MPAHRGQALGAGDRARVPGLVGHVFTEVAAFIGHQYHVVLGGLGEQRHVGLGAAALVVIKAPGFFRHQLQAEALGGAAQGGGIGLIVRRRADNQQRPLPFAQHQKLRQRIGEHRPARQGVQHVRQAIGGAQAVIGTAGVEQQTVGQCRTQLAQAGRGGIHHKQAQALFMLHLCRFEQGLGAVDAGADQAVAVVEKTPGAVAVGDRQFGAAQPGIGGLGDDVRQQRAGVGAITQVADPHLQGRIGGLALGGQAGGAGNRQQIDQGVRGKLAHKALHDR
ncbi:hypothetical protein D3C84_333710 [compost metagenome]